MGEIGSQVLATNCFFQITSTILPTLTPPILHAYSNTVITPSLLSSILCHFLLHQPHHLLPLTCCHIYDIFAGGRSDYYKRAGYINDHQRYAFAPMMMRCLEERPSARGTFEDALEDIQICLKKYGKNNQTEMLEGNMVKCSLVIVF